MEQIWALQVATAVNAECSLTLYSHQHANSSTAFTHLNGQNVMNKTPVVKCKCQLPLLGGVSCRPWRRTL